MKKIKFLLTILFCFCMTAGALTFVGHAAEEQPEYQVVNNEEGDFAGINITNSVEGAFWAGHKDWADMSSLKAYGLTGIAFNPIDPAQSDYFLVKMRGPISSPRGFRMLLEGDDGIFYKTYLATGGTERNDTFITEKNEVKSFVSSTVQTVVNEPNMTGTLNIPWENIVGAYGENEGDPIGSGTKIVAMYFGFNMGNGNFSGGNGLTIGTIATVSVSADSIVYEEVLNTADLTYTNDALDVTSDVNLADVTKGTVISGKYIQYGTNTVVTGGDATVQSNLQKAAKNWLYSRSAYSVAVKYQDAEGNELKSSETFMTTYDPSQNTFLYDIDSPEITGYNFKESSLPLQGSVKNAAEIVLTYERKSFVLTVKYVDESGEEICYPTVTESESADYKIEIPEIDGFTYLSASGDLSGTMTEDLVVTLTYKQNQSANYEVVKDIDGALVGVNLKNSILKSVFFGVVSADSFVPAGAYGLATIDFGRPVDTSMSDVLLVKVKGPNKMNYGFRILLEDDMGRFYRVGSAESRQDVFINDDGSQSFMETKNYDHMFDALEKTGTLHLRWENVVGAYGVDWAGVPMAEGTKICKIHIAMAMTRSVWSGYGIGVGTIATMKEAADGNVVVKEILNTAEMEYTQDAENTTADINLADMTKGQRVYCKYSATGNFIFQDETNDMSIAASKNWQCVREAYKLTVLYIDNKGVVFKGPITLKSVYDSEADVFEYVIPTPELYGYEFATSDIPLEGTLTEDKSVTVRYQPKKYSVTINFVDSEGNKIKESEVVSREYLQALGLGDMKVNGYDFVSSLTDNDTLVVRDMTVTLVYEKSDVNIGLIVLITGIVLFVAAAATISWFVVKKNKKINQQ